MKFAIDLYKDFEYIFSLKQKEMKNLVAKQLAQFYPQDKICNIDDYIYAIGDIPIALVAHLDTVWEDAPPSFIFFDPFKKVMWSPYGLGADDRAGCIAILEILKHGLRPHVIFTTDEEIGGIGASILASQPCPFDNLNYIIELDRRGRNDCVFYDCESKDFQKYIKTFGFKLAYGTFSDISMLCGSWQICGVNLSIGYLNEHTRTEVLFLDSMYSTINRVIKMLSVKDIPKYKWEGLTYIPYEDEFDWLPDYAPTKPFIRRCSHCFKAINDQDSVMVRAGNSIKDYCFDCLITHASYCPRCGQPFENLEGISSEKLCAQCQEEENEIYTSGD